MWSSSIRVRDGARQRGPLAAGAATVLVAVGPLESWTSGSLTAHMTQHLLLLAVAPPLLALGAGVGVPEGAWAWWTAVALAVHSAVMTVWHLPGPFDAALQHAPVHLVE